MSFIKSREEYNHKGLDNNFGKSEVSIMFYFQSCDILLSNHYTPHNKVVGGYTGFTMSVRPSVDKSYVVR